LFHDEWRPPPRPRTPPDRSPPPTPVARRSWGDTVQRRQSSPARIETRAPPAQIRREDAAPRNVRPEVRENIRREEPVERPRVHPDRRDMVPVSNQRPQSRQRPGQLRLDVDENYSTQADLPSSQTYPKQVREVPSQTPSERGYEPPSAEEVRRAALEQIVRERGAAEQMRLSLKRQKEADDNERLLAQATRGAATAAKSPRNTHSRVQMLEERHSQFPSTRTNETSSSVGPSEPRGQKSLARPNELPNELSVIAPALSKSTNEDQPGVLADNQSQRASRWDQKPRTAAVLEHMKRRHEESSLKPEPPMKQRNQLDPGVSTKVQHANIISQSSRKQPNGGSARSSQPTTSLPTLTKTLTNGDDDIHQKQNSTLAADMAALKPGTAMPQAVSAAYASPPGFHTVVQQTTGARHECLSTLVTRLILAVGKSIDVQNAVISHQKHPENQTASTNSVVKNMHGASLQVSPNLLSAAKTHPRVLGLAPESSPSGLATVDEVTITNVTTFQVGDKAPPRVDAPLLLNQDGNTSDDTY
jgi:hypothetical protein